MIKLDMSCIFASNPFFVPCASVQIAHNDLNFTLVVEGDKMTLRHGSTEIALKEKALCHMLKYYWDENVE